MSASTRVPKGSDEHRRRLKAIGALVLAEDAYLEASGWRSFPYDLPDGRQRVAWLHPQRTLGRIDPMESTEAIALQRVWDREEL